jgi:creatinine amidohydrolase/Fe(II)-dependent formamide hydrolase-like protein
MERWSVEHRAFAVETYFKKQRFCLDSEDISSALHYSSERVSLVAILLPLGISQEQGVRKETKGNDGLETEHKGRSGSSFSRHAATSDAELPETLAGMC